jgi:hypothetical protein
VAKNKHCVFVLRRSAPEAFDCLLSFISALPAFAGSRQLEDACGERAGSIAPRFTVGFGADITFPYNGRMLTIARPRLDGAAAGNSRGGSGSLAPDEFFVLSAHKRDSTALDTLIADAMSQYNATISDHVHVFQLFVRGDGSCDWVRVRALAPRSLDSVVLTQAQADAVCDAAGFFDDATKRFYRESAQPYRRGYLLYGEPGCGKSTFPMIVASALKRNLYLLTLDNAALTDAALSQAMLHVPSGSIIVIEEVDVVPAARKRVLGTVVVTDTDGGITPAGLYNVLDGLTTPHGSIVYMTSNHPNVLDDALVRAGRMDVHVEFGALDTECAAALFRKMLRLPATGPAVALSTQLELEFRNCYTSAPRQRAAAELTNLILGMQCAAGLTQDEKFRRLLDAIRT